MKLTLLKIFSLFSLIGPLLCIACISHWLKTRLCEALARVESLEQELRNVKDRERRAKKTVRDLLEDLKGKNLINEDLKERLSFYSGKMKIISSYF